MSSEEVCRTVSRMSQIFSLSVDNSLRPKFAYLVSEIGGGKELLLRCPSYLTLSLHARIIPRHRFLLHCGRAEQPFSPFHFTLNEERFLKSAGATAEQYEAWRLLHGFPAAAAPSARERTMSAAEQEQMGAAMAR